MTKLKNVTKRINILPSDLLISFERIGPTNIQTYLIQDYFLASDHEIIFHSADKAYPIYIYIYICNR
jgi:hypothetical protein